MSPIPYVRGQVIVLAFFVTAAGALGSATVSIICGLFSICWMLLLRGKYRRDLLLANRPTPPHRRSLDQVVAGDALVTLIPATTVAIIFLAFSIDPPSWSSYARGPTTALMIAAVGVYASSLVDWYVILPRISGQLGARPCRAAREQEEFAFPNTWKEVTRWWYIHRIVSAFVFRAGLSAAFAIVIGEVSGLDSEARWLAAAAMTVIFSAYTLTAIGRGVGQAGHAKVIVGQTVRIERRAGRRRPWLPFLKLPPLQFDGRYYVFDVAIEQIQFAAIDPREKADLASPLKFEKNPDSVYLADIDAVRQAMPKFSGCDGRCSGINWYCIENPRCFDPK